MSRAQADQIAALQIELEETKAKLAEFEKEQAEIDSFVEANLSVEQFGSYMSKLDAAESRASAAEAQVMGLREALGLGEESLDIRCRADALAGNVDDGDLLSLKTMRAALASDAGRAFLEEKKRLEDRVARLESNIDHSVCLDAEGERIHFGARVVCGQCFGSQEQHLKNARAERDALKARHEAAMKVVEAARGVHLSTCGTQYRSIGNSLRCDCHLVALAAFDALPEAK